MNNEKYSYDFEIILGLRQFQKNFESKGLETDTRYLDHYGDTCPRCKSRFKVYGNDVKNVGSISAFLVMEQKKAVLYCVCKKCAKELKNSSTIETDARMTEEYIFSKLPDLKRNDNNPISREDLENEIDILTDIT